MVSARHRTRALLWSRCRPSSTSRGKQDERRCIFAGAGGLDQLHLLEQVKEAGAVRRIWCVVNALSDSV